MAKDPAFLFYSKDWIEGTAEYMPEEKGVYIDLLCFQHQRGGIPNDIERLAKMVGLSIERFQKIWDVISNHFEPNGEPNGDRLVNRKLNEVMTERSEKSKVNTITGTFASILRQGNFDKKKYNYLKSNFKVENFINTPKENITERLTEWLTECLKSIEDGNGNEIVNEDINIVTWRNNFEKYKSELNTVYQNLILNNAYIQEQEKFHPNIDIKLSLEKAVTNYWATEAGWHHKKKSKSDDINWKATLTNAIDLNKVYKPRTFEQKQEPNIQKSNRLI